MKRIIPLLCAIAFLMLSTAGFAAAKQPVKKSSRALEGIVNTRIGKLQFEMGYPSDATIKKLYNELDFQRAVQAYIWGLPMVEMA